MKTFEVRIGKTRTADCTDFTWPSWWKEVYQQVDVVAYEDAGKSTEGAVCLCGNDIWAIIEAKRDSRIKLLTEKEANSRGRKWRPQTAYISDAAAVLENVARLRSGLVLSREQENSLDADSPTPGISQSRLFDIRQLAEEAGGILD